MSPSSDQQVRIPEPWRRQLSQHHIEPYVGYALTALREAGGEETARLDAFMTLHRLKVLHVSNGGEGGSHRYQLVGGDFAAFRSALADFEAYATTWNQPAEFAGIEDADQLGNRFVEVAALNRRRGVLFLFDDEDYRATGVAHSFLVRLTLAQAVEHLYEHYAMRRPRVWDRSVGDFVAVVALTASDHSEVR